MSSRHETAPAGFRREAPLSLATFDPVIWLLPRAKRQGIVALRAWWRRSRDIVDRPATLAERQEALDSWRLELEAVFDGRLGEAPDPAARALAPVLRRFAIPRGLFVELLAGVEMDLRIDRYPTAAELERYARRVASAAGLLAIEILGYEDARARDYAASLGLALQLTTILRDVRGDLARGRVYLPLEDLARHGVAVADLLAGRDPEGLRRAAGETAARARAHFARARDSFPRRDRRTLFPAEAVGGVGRRILDRIEASGWDVLGSRPRVGTPVKAWIALREWARSRG